MIKQEILKIQEKVLEKKTINFNEAKKLSQTEEKETLYQCADEIREQFIGKNFDLCSVTNAKSGKCPQDCQWCSQSSQHQTGIDEYNLIDKKTAVESAIKNRKYGVNRYSLVTSGRGVSKKDLDKLCTIYEEIKTKTDIKLCASMGIVNEEKLRKLKDVGIGHYHCNLETSRSFFPTLVSTHTYDEKINTIKTAQKAGLKICSGGIIGMGETMEQRIELAFELQKLNVQSIPINILMPIKGTKLEKAPPLSEEEILTTIALFRFINPRAHLRFAGGRLKIKSFEKKALRAGISSALVGDLLTTIGSNVEEDIQNFKKAGFQIAK